MLHFEMLSKNSSTSTLVCQFSDRHFTGPQSKVLKVTGVEVLYSLIMEKGFNSDVAWLGGQYHIQTEDWGIGNPFFVSRVFHNGAVVKSIKTGYEEVLPKTSFTEVRSIRLAMKIQHQQILDLLLSGQLL